jgi:hypothetical protein
MSATLNGLVPAFYTSSPLIDDHPCLQEPLGCGSSLSRKLSPELQVPFVVCLLCVDASDPQDKSEDLVLANNLSSKFLDQNWLHAIVVIVINHMPILVVLVEDLCVTKGANLLISIGLIENPFLLHPPHSLFHRLA